MIDEKDKKNGRRINKIIQRRKVQWTWEENIELLTLIKEHGANYVKIGSEALSHKTENQMYAHGRYLLVKMKEKPEKFKGYIEIFDINIETIYK